MFFSCFEQFFAIHLATCGGGRILACFVLKYETGVISIMPAKVPHEVVAGADGLYLFAKFMPALC